MTTPTANEQTATNVDDVTALSLWVCWLNNLNVPDRPLPNALIIQGSRTLRRIWQANGYTPVNVVTAGTMYAAAAWAEVAEVDKLVWIQRLIKVCER
jgi:hypothetical protein